MAVLTNNPALNQRLMQLDREYEQQRSNLMQSFYNNSTQQNNWNNQQTQPPQTNQGLLWVQGEAGAKSYLVAPNTTVLLMDSEGSRFYLKSTDNAGMPSLRVFEYSEITQNTPQAPQNTQTDLDDKYVTRAEYDALSGKYAEILDRLNSFPTGDLPTENGSRPAATTTKSRGKGGNANE